MLADYHVALAEHQLWVGELGGNVVAVLELLPLPTHLLIENIAVQPERQGSGVGRLLLAFAEQEATRQGYAEVRLYTNAKFTENLAIYSKLGYRELRREVTPAAEIVHMSKLVTRAA